MTSSGGIVPTTRPANCVHKVIFIPGGGLTGGADGFEASHPRTSSGMFGWELVPTIVRWELAIAMFKHELVPRVGLRAPVDGRTCGRTGGRTDGRACNDIVLSHDHKRIFVKKCFRESKKSEKSFKCPTARAMDFL